MFRNDQSLGSRLMIEPGLSRHPDGQPYQVILLVNEAKAVVGIATDEDGRALGWPHPPYQGDDFDEDAADLNLRAKPVPADVDAAAKAWWAESSEARGPRE